jgi:hypothetical protein
MEGGAQTRTLIRGNHASREFLCRMFELRQEGVLVDVELLADTGERGIRAHRLLLAACSPYFNRHSGGVTKIFLVWKGGGKKGGGRTRELKLGLISRWSNG